MDNLLKDLLNSIIIKLINKLIRLPENFAVIKKKNTNYLLINMNSLVRFINKEY